MRFAVMRRFFLARKVFEASAQSHYLGNTFEVRANLSSPRGVRSVGRQILDK
jgi:hypothetical protein